MVDLVWPDVDVAALAPTMVVVSLKPGRPWYVTFTIDMNAPSPWKKTVRAVGVDLGVKDFAVTSDGEKIVNRGTWRARPWNLARYQRRLARRQKGSANLVKAKMKVARADWKVRDAWLDYLHRASTRLVRSADMIVIEDLNVSGMVRNRRRWPAPSATAAGASSAASSPTSATAPGAPTVIDRWYPLSKTCSECGYLLAGLQPFHPAMDVAVLRRPA